MKEGPVGTAFPITYFYNSIIITFEGVDEAQALPAPEAQTGIFDDENTLRIVSGTTTGAEVTYSR